MKTVFRASELRKLPFSDVAIGQHFWGYYEKKISYFIRIKSSYVGGESRKYAFHFNAIKLDDGEQVKFEDSEYCEVE